MDIKVPFAIFSGKKETVYNRKYSFDLNDRIRARVFGAIPKQNIGEVPDSKPTEIKASEKLDSSLENETILNELTDSGLIFEKIERYEKIDPSKLLEKNEQSGMVEKVAKPNEELFKKVSSDDSQESDCGSAALLDESPKTWKVSQNLETSGNANPENSDCGDDESSQCSNRSFISDLQFAPESFGISIENDLDRVADSKLPDRSRVVREERKMPDMKQVKHFFLFD